MTRPRSCVPPLVALLLAGSATLAFAGFPGSDVFLPMVGRQAGVYPSNWYTKVWIHNPGAEAATARLYFLQRGTANLGAPWVDVMVAPGDTESFDNAVETLFHVEAFGAIRVTCATQKLLVTSRVYSLSPGKTERDSLGQDFVAVPAAFAIGQGERTQVLGVNQALPAATSECRYNFGFVETTGHGATVRVTVYDENHAWQGSKEFGVLAYSQRQVAFKDNFPAVSAASSRLEVEVISGQGKVIAYGSSITNGSQDPTTYEMAYPERVLAAPPAPGITGVTAGNGLIGGGTSGTVTLDVGAGDGIAVSADGVALADGAVTQAKLAAAGGTSGQVLGTDGSALVWRDDAGLTLPYSDTKNNNADPLFQVINTGTGPGVRSESSGGIALHAYSNNGMAGVFGRADRASAYGVLGVAHEDTSAGVWGESGYGIGVWGTSGTGMGVRGESTTGVAVDGQSDGPIGVNGRCTKSGGIGVKGEATAGITAVGVLGLSTVGAGVRGSSGTGTGVSGVGSTGVFGECVTGDGNGIWGVANNAWGAGVRGESTTGIGVLGMSSSLYGVKGSSGSSFGVWAEGGSLGLYAHHIGGDGHDVYLATGALAGDFYGNVNVRPLAGSGNRAVYSTGDGVLTNSSSDIRLKKDVVPLADRVDVLAALAGLRGVEYGWDTSVERAAMLGQRREIGFVAQEVEGVLPQVVGADTEGYLTVDYAKLTAFLVEVAKAQQARIEALEQRLAALQAR